MQQQLGDIVAQDPDVGSYRRLRSAAVGSALNNRPPVHRPEADAIERDGGSAADHQPAAAEDGQGRRAASCSCRRSQDVRVGGRCRRPQYQYTLQDANLDELNAMGAEDPGQAAVAADAARRDHRPAAGGTTATLTIDRDAAARFGIQPQVIDDTLYDAFGQRQITQYFTQVNSYHVILEVPPEMQGDPTRWTSCTCKSPTTGQAVPLSASCTGPRVPVQPLSISHQSQFPAVTISFNLAPGVALGQAVTRSSAAMRQMRRAGHRARRASRAPRRRSSRRWHPAAI